MLENLPSTYKIIGKIGAGNNGEIYKAYHKNLKKEVVLKKIRANVKDIMNNRAEVDVLKKLRHSCLPQVLDFLEVDGDIYTVMDFIPGKSFQQYLSAGSIFPEKSVIVWAKQICSTLCYLHEQNPPIVHSDLKPGNIMLMPNGNICLIDFNTSAGIDGDTAWVTGYTNGYAAPEQIRALQYNQNELDRKKWKTVDARADIYSLGATLYHLLTGIKPHMEGNGYVEDIRDLNVKISGVFARIIMKCMEPDPSRRYQTSEQLLMELENIQRKDKRYKALLIRQKLIYFLVAAGMLLCAGIGAAGFFRMDRDKQKEYEKLVRLEIQCISEEDFDDFEIYYQKAIALLPERLDAYYQKALALHHQRQYGDCIDYINGSILSNESLPSKNEALNNIYYLLGNSYEKMGNYTDAVFCYERAIEYQPNNSDYYRDYAIALAYSGDLNAAKGVLDNAGENGLNSTEINYVEGEIDYCMGQYTAAEDIFSQCIQDGQDDYIKMRSYIMLVKCIDAQGISIGGNNEKIKLLEQAREQLPKENNIGILELLAQVYCDMGSQLGDSSYYQKAISVFAQIDSQGMASYDTKYNLAVLYQNVGDYGKALETMNLILEEYGENYKTYKALAFLELAKQSKVENTQKSYMDFDGYYHKAEELYQKMPDNNDNDVEMDRLSELHTQAISNQWLSE